MTGEEILRKPDPRERTAACLQVCDLPGGMSALLQVALNDPNDYVGCFATALLGLRWRRRWLMKVLAESRSELRIFEATVLLTMWRESSAMPLVEPLLDHPSWQVRLAACEFCVFCVRDAKPYWGHIRRLEDELRQGAAGLERSPGFLPAPIFRSEIEARARLKQLKRSSRKFRRPRRSSR